MSELTSLWPEERSTVRVVSEVLSDNKPASISLTGALLAIIRRLDAGSAYDRARPSEAGAPNDRRFEGRSVYDGTCQS